ncbi:MAG: T-complex 10 C-terminal domain-containing protein [bacterium]|nr:T-complex 10 C-terminal domain-containing protein [bacterium]
MSGPIEILCVDGIKDEDIYITPFIQYYLPINYPECFTVNLIWPDKNNTYTNPDYFLVEPKIAIEVKRVYESGRPHINKAWEQTCSRLRKEFLKRNISGTYVAQISHYLNIPPGRGMEKLVMDKIAKDILDGKIEKMDDNGSKISFFSNGCFSGITRETIEESLKRSIEPLLKTANKQLGSYRENETFKRLLLLVNYHKTMPGNVQNHYETVIQNTQKVKYSNIDEIWIQYGPDEKVTHSLVFSRESR